MTLKSSVAVVFKNPTRSIFSDQDEMGLNDLQLLSCDRTWEGVKRGIGPGSP